MSRPVIVVSDLSDAEGLPTTSVVEADRYLEGADGLIARDAMVVNLCRSFRYRTKGYYVSLLADARGQQVLPTVEIIEGLLDPFGLSRALQEAGVPTVEATRMRTRRLPQVIAPEEDEAVAPGERRTAPLLRVSGDQSLEYRAAGQAEVAEVIACFGRVEDRRFREVAQAVYEAWPAPLLRLGFVRAEEEWQVAKVTPATLPQLKPQERERLAALLADEEWLRRQGAPALREEVRASLAVLVDPEDEFSPSTPETIDHLTRVGARMGVYVHRLGLSEIGKLGEYDALFIRALTGVREPAFPFALRAEALGMPVADDTQSIIRCTNKVFLEELLRREGIPTPRTMVLTSKTPWEQVSALGLPLVLKLPDSSFSAAVYKVSTPEEYQQRVSTMFRRSPLVIAQEFLPTDFDWRITVLGGKLLFAAKYYMVEGHWQIRSEGGGEEERYGRVEAVPRARAPRDVVEMALRAAALIGDGLYGVDLKQTERGPVVIEVNDNPNLDRGDDDAADGDVIYEDVIRFFLERLEDGGGDAESQPRHYRPFEVVGIEMEYAIVDEALNAASLVEPALRALAGRPTSDASLGEVELSNEIADHVLELKVAEPARSLPKAEAALAEGVRRTAAMLRERFGARLLPTGMHPWMDPREGRLWRRSYARVYQTYARLFDVYTHGWMNVHALHLNFPFGREHEAIAMHNAATLLLPYLPAIAASSPVHDGRLQEEVDGRLAWILKHQSRIPESCGELIPEYVESFTDYRRRVLRPMYRALDRYPDAEAIRHEFLNARGAVLRFARRAMEVRVLDTQECVKMDIAVAVFVRAALRWLSERVLAGEVELPDHGLLVRDFRSVVREGSTARVRAPHLGGEAKARDVLRTLLRSVRRSIPREEAEYLPLIEGMIEAGSLSERMRVHLQSYTGDEAAFRQSLRELYAELATCLERNEPWSGRGLPVPIGTE